MRIDQFHTVINAQLERLGGSVQVSIKPETRGYTVSLYVSDGCKTSKFYTENDVSTFSPQLVRVQVTHLYNQLAQAVLDSTLGEGVMYVIR